MIKLTKIKYQSIGVYANPKTMFLDDIYLPSFEATTHQHIATYLIGNYNLGEIESLNHSSDSSRLSLTFLNNKQRFQLTAIISKTD